MSGHVLLEVGLGVELAAMMMIRPSEGAMLIRNQHEH
jgi:hypothetical protein